MKMELLEKRKVDGDIYLFTFRPEGPLTWKAGQQMVFTLEHPYPDSLGIARSLSIASAPFEEIVSVLTRCGSRSSSFKKALKEMREGDIIQAGEPEGDFVLDDPHKQYTFIASGVGISPFRAMVVDLDYRNLPINATLIYGHTSERFPFKDELEEVLGRRAGFRIFYTLDSAEKERGRIKEVVARFGEHPIYMSGVYVRTIARMFGHPGRETSSCLTSASSHIP